MEAVEKVAKNPYEGSKLSYKGIELFKWRVGDYRIIYSIDESSKKVVFYIVGHRRKVYKEL